MIGTVHSYVQFGTNLDLKWYWDNTELTSAQHPLQILENYNNDPLNEVIGISSIKNDVAGNYIEISVSSPADAPDMEWIILESLSGRTRNGFIYDEYGLLRYTSEFPPQVDFKRRINCGDVLGDDTDDGIVGNLSREIALKIVTQNFDGINPQVLKFRFYLEDQFFEDYNYNLMELTGNIRIEDCLGESRECLNFPFLQPGPVTFNPPPGPITVENGQWQFIDMYSNVNGTIYFTDLFYTNCAEIPDVRWGYSPYYYDENETRWRRIPNSTGIFCLKAAVYTGGENFTDNVCGCWDVTVITGVYDYLNISELSATQTLIENNNYYYEAFFVDADNDGTTFNDWNWKLKLFHSGGEFVLATSNSSILTGFFNCLPASYSWSILNGKIQGIVECFGYDSDGIYQEDVFPIEAELASTCLSAPVISHFTQTPSPICQGSSGYVYVHLQQGSGSLNYSWTIENLPPGAYITPLGNKCRVTYPESLMSVGNLFEQSTLAPTNYISCTVSNAVGSDSKSANVSMSSTCDPTGCPTLAFGNGNEIVNENTMLINSLSNPGEDVTDYYLINSSNKIENGNIGFYIHEPSEEHTWFDEIELWELKADKGEFIAVTDEGE